MARHNPLTIALLFSLFTGGVSLSVSADGTEPGATDRAMTLALEEIARGMGDSYGHLVITDSAGQRKLLAIGERELAIYSRGDAVGADTTFALCDEEVRPDFRVCPEFTVNPRDPQPYSCGPDVETGEDFCGCENIADCIVMVFAGVCGDAPWHCTDNGDSGCTCG